MKNGKFYAEIWRKHGKISGSQCDQYEDDCILVCYAVKYGNLLEENIFSKYFLSCLT
jgi:hypothetical protein